MTIALAQAAIGNYFSEWARTDGPWWEADLVLGVYRHLDSSLCGTEVEIPAKARRTLVWFLENEDWKAVKTPQVATQNVIPTLTANKQSNKRYGDLCCRSSDGRGFDWILEAKIATEDSNTRNAALSAVNQLIPQMLTDLAKCQSISTPWDTRPTVFLVGFYSQGPASTANIEELACQCVKLLSKGHNDKKDPHQQGMFYVGLKQRRRGTSSAMLVTHSLKVGSNSRPIP
jgi:hypothetical protein